MSLQARQLNYIWNNTSDRPHIEYDLMTDGRMHASIYISMAQRITAGRFPLALNGVPVTSHGNYGDNQIQEAAALNV